MGAPLTPHAIRAAPLRVGASLDGVLWRHGRDRSRTVKLAAGLLAAGAAALLAHLAGADIRAGFAGGQPDLAQQLVRGLLSRPTPLG
jgi:hypothetical protein